jgi:ssDNA-binding replication factor A large subunit
MSVAILPISEISAYHTKWTIKARVTNKAPMRTFKKGAGEGKVFSVDLLDADGGEIRASFFNDAAEKFEKVLAVKKCYTFGKGRAKVANSQYNNTNHRYELIFENDAVIAESVDDVNIVHCRASSSSTSAPYRRNQYHSVATSAVSSRPSGRRPLSQRRMAGNL